NSYDTKPYDPFRLALVIPLPCFMPMTMPASPLPTGSPSTNANRLPSPLTAPGCGTSPLGEPVRAPVPSTDTAALKRPPPLLPLPVWVYEQVAPPLQVMSFDRTSWLLVPLTVPPEIVTGSLIAVLASPRVKGLPCAAVKLSLKPPSSWTA